METGQEKSSASLPMKLFLLGFLLVFVGFVVIMSSALLGGDGTMSGGAVIFIGPIPIILGAGPDAFPAIIVASVLTLIGFVVFFWMRRQIPRS